VAYRSVVSFACTSGGPINNLTVAIINSDAHSHIHKHGIYEEYRCRFY
jgi:hypothetical protein